MCGESRENVEDELDSVSSAGEWLIQGWRSETGSWCWRRMQIVDNKDASLKWVGIGRWSVIRVKASERRLRGVLSTRMVRPAAERWPMHGAISSTANWFWHHALFPNVSDSYVEIFNCMLAQPRHGVIVRVWCNAGISPGKLITHQLSTSVPSPLVVLHRNKTDLRPGRRLAAHRSWLVLNCFAANRSWLDQSGEIHCGQL